MPRASKRRSWTYLFTSFGFRNANFEVGFSSPVCSSAERRLGGEPARGCSQAAQQGRSLDIQALVGCRLKSWRPPPKQPGKSVHAALTRLFPPRVWPLAFLHHLKGPALVGPDVTPAEIIVLFRQSPSDCRRPMTRFTDRAQYACQRKSGLNTRQSAYVASPTSSYTGQCRTKLSRGVKLVLMVTQGVLALSEAFGLFREPDSSRVSGDPKRLIKADGIPGSWPCHSSTCCINSDGRCRTPATHGPQQFLRRNAGATAFGTAGVHAGKDAV